MFYYTVNEDIVLQRTIRKRIKTTQEAVSYLHEIKPGVQVFVLQANADTLYGKCKELSEFSEDYVSDGWYVSEEMDDAKAGAVLSVIEAYRLWEILMTEEKFDEWIKTNVR